MYFNISEMKLSITSLYIISNAPKYDSIRTENSDVIDIDFRDIEVQILDPCVLAQKILDREIHTIQNNLKFFDECWHSDRNAAR